MAVAAHHAISALGSRHYKPWIGRIPFIFLYRIGMCSSALHLVPINVNGGVHGDCVLVLGFVSAALALDFATLGISGFALYKLALRVFTTVSISVSSLVYINKANVRGWSGSCTPQVNTLLLVGQTHAIHTVRLSIGTRGAIHHVDIGGAEGVVSATEFRQVTGPRLLPTQSPC